MLRSLAAISAFAALAGCQNPPVSSRQNPAPDAPAVAPGPGPYEYTCDAPSGEFDNQKVNATSERIVVKGTFQFDEIRSDVKWASVASISVPGIQASTGFELMAIVKRNDKRIQFQAATFQSGPGKATSIVPLASSDVTRNPIAFEITMKADGTTSVALGTYGYVVPTKAYKAKGEALSCSTARVIFHNVVVASAP
jgi:hypothetical protein